MNTSNGQFCNKSLLKEEVDLENSNNTFQHDTNLLNPATFMENYQLNDTNVLYDDEHADADNEADDEASMLQHKNTIQMNMLNQNTCEGAPLTAYPFPNYSTQQQQQQMVLMGPPTPSTDNLSYGFDYTAQEQQRDNLQHATTYQNYPPPQMTTNNQHMLSSYNNANSMKAQSAQYSGGTQYTQPTTSSFYNKVWYPNAAHNRHELPALTNSRPCSTLLSNIYYNGPSCSHADPMLDMLQLSNR